MCLHRLNRTNCIPWHSPALPGASFAATITTTQHHQQQQCQWEVHTPGLPLLLTLRCDALELGAQQRQLPVPILQQGLLHRRQDASLGRRKCCRRERSAAAAAAEGAEGRRSKVAGGGLHLLQVFQRQHGAWQAARGGRCRSVDLRAGKQGSNRDTGGGIAVGSRTRCTHRHTGSGS